MKMGILVACLGRDELDAQRSKYQAGLRLSLYQLGCFGLWVKESHTGRGSNVRKKLCCIMRTLEGGSSRVANSAAGKKVNFFPHCHSSEWIWVRVFLCWFIYIYSFVLFFVVSKGNISQKPHPQALWPGLYHMAKPKQVPGQGHVPTAVDLGQSRFTPAPRSEEGHLRHVAAQQMRWITSGFC